MSEFTTTVHTYTVTVGTIRARKGVSRRDAAWMLRIARSIGKPVKVEHTATFMRVPWEKCYGCQARPVKVETDCDGTFPTSSCESPQCKWWQCVETREADETRAILRRELMAGR